MKIILIRHATSCGQAPDAGLTRQGHAQAENLSHQLANLNIDALFCSPYRRAKATIEPFARASGHPIMILDDLRERCLAPPPLPDWQLHVARSFKGQNYALPNGESLNQTCNRALKALADIAVSGAAHPAAVSHGNLIASVLNRIDPGFGFAQWQAMQNPHLFELTLTDTVPTKFLQL